MDYVYHYYHKWDHGGGHGGQSLPFSTLTRPCSCTCFTCLYKLDLLLVLIVISLLVMDKITININTSTFTTMMTTTTSMGSSLPLTSGMSNIVTSTSSEPIPLLNSSLSISPSSSTSSSLIKRSPSTITTTTTSSSSLSSFIKMNSPLPWDSITNTHHGVTLNNSERSSPSDQPESLPDSLNSFCSYGSLRRKLIKPDISLDFLDSSSSSSDSDDVHQEHKSLKRKMIRRRRKISNDTHSLTECNLFNGCANDEHFYRDTSLSEETFTNDRLIVHPPSSSLSIVNCS